MVLKFCNHYCRVILMTLCYWIPHKLRMSLWCRCQDSKTTQWTIFSKCSPCIIKFKYCGLHSNINDLDVLFARAFKLHGFRGLGYLSLYTLYTIEVWPRPQSTYSWRTSIKFRKKCVICYPFSAPKKNVDTMTDIN